MIAVRHEADLDAIGLAGDLTQSGLPSECPNVVLAVVAHGENEPVEHLPADAPEDIRLVLVRVGAAVEFRAGRSAFDTGVVASGDEVGVDAAGEFPQSAELQPRVADDARIRRASLQ